MKKYTDHLKKVIVICTLCSLVLPVFGPTRVEAADDTEAPVVPGEYIVVFKEVAADKPQKKALTQFQKTEAAKASTTRASVEKKFKTKTKKKFSKALKGFSAKLTSSEVRELERNPAVEYVVPNRVIKTSAADNVSKQSIPTGIDRINANGLSNTGAGIGVAVIDTGINSSHPDLAGQVVGGVNCIDPGKTSYEDDNLHGTHVAGTIAALDNNIGVVGVAPGAKLWSVKVLDKKGSGTWESVICGLDFVTAKAPVNGGPIRVANLSLSGNGKSDDSCGLKNEDPLHAAICRARDAGVVIVAAAGNDGGDVAKKVPAAYNDAVITVSALADYDGFQGFRHSDTRDDKFASFSNYNSGKRNSADTIDIGAPGVNIKSTALGNTYAVLSGTSMATPHVSGAVALYLAENSNAPWTEVRDALIRAGEEAGPDTHKDSSPEIADTPGDPHLEPVLLVGSNPTTLPDKETLKNPPTISNFYGPRQDRIYPSGTNISITYSVKNASTTTLEADGVVVPLMMSPASSDSNRSGFHTVKPLKTTTYKLVATNPYGSVSKTLVVKIHDTTSPPGDGQNDTVGPVVTLTEPLVTKKLNPSSTVNISAIASDNVAVTNVNFFVDSVSLCTDTQAPYTCVWNVPATTGQSYLIKASASDPSGNTTEVTRTVRTKSAPKPPTTTPVDITITEPTFTPSTIGKRGKVQVDTSVTFKKSILEGTYIQYSIKDSAGKILYTAKKDILELDKKAHLISFKPVLKPSTSGDSLVLVVEVLDRDGKVLFEKTSTSKINVQF